MKIVRNVYVNDAPVLRRTRARDEILHAISSGKLLALGRVWTSQVKPFLDTQLDALAPLVTGLTSGRVLHAEPVPAVIDLGRLWLGDLASRLGSAAREAEGVPGSEGKVDVTDVAREVEQLYSDLGLADRTVLADRIRAVRHAADQVGRTCTGDGNVTRITPDSIRYMEGLNDQARRFWSERSSPPTGRASADNSLGARTAVRDQLAVAARATDVRTRMEALNAAARAFWATRVA